MRSLITVFIAYGSSIVAAVVLAVSGGAAAL